MNPQDLAEQLEQYPALQDTMFPAGPHYIERRLTEDERDLIVRHLRAALGVQVMLEDTILILGHRPEDDSWDMDGRQTYIHDDAP